MEYHESKKEPGMVVAVPGIKGFEFLGDKLTFWWLEWFLFPDVVGQDKARLQRLVFSVEPIAVVLDNRSIKLV